MVFPSFINPASFVFIPENFNNNTSPAEFSLLLLSKKNPIYFLSLSDSKLIVFISPKGISIFEPAGLSICIIGFSAFI